MAARRMELLKDEYWSRRMAAQAVTDAANGLAYVVSSSLPCNATSALASTGCYTLVPCSPCCLRLPEAASRPWH